MTIIDRYILRETFKSFLAIFSVMVLILISHALMKLMQYLANGRYSTEILSQMIGLEAISAMGVIAPPAFFFAILYSLGRMYRDSEMTALFAGGVGMGRIYRAYLTLAIPLTLVVALFTLAIIPEMTLLEDRLKQQTREQASLNQLPQGRFNTTRGGKLTYYFESLSEDGERLRNIFIHDAQRESEALITARTGFQQSLGDGGDRFIVLQQGRHYQGIAGQADYATGEFEQYGLRVEHETHPAQFVPHKARNTTLLLASDDIADRSELQRRWVMALAILVFTLISIPLSRSMPREGIYGRLVLAILFYFVFINLMTLSGDWMVKGVTPEWLGRWWVHPFMLAFSGLLLYVYDEPTRLRFWRRLRRSPDTDEHRRA